jgi:hypothetical protein
MTPETLIRRFHDLAGFGSEVSPDADSLIGVFQVFRPDGRAVVGLYDDLEDGEQLLQRLEHLYAVAGDDRRPQGGRDAYFVVRNPPALDPDLANQYAKAWLAGLRALAVSLGDVEIAERLDPLPTIRVLEGIAPKHPKDEAEKSGLLRTLQQDVPSLVERIDAGPYPAALRPAYYFTACDSMLRDYLMWPLYSQTIGLADPFQNYFELWKHGVKYRIFGETQVDLYLPRQQN